jgi:nitrogen PTS system EIIA component
MDLEKSDIADLLNVCDETVNRLIEEDRIPYYTLDGQKRFSRYEVEDWMLKVFCQEDEILPFSSAQEGEVKNLYQQYAFYRAIHKGIVIDQVEGDTKESFIHEAMHRIRDQVPFNEEVITTLLLEREELMPTAIGKSIAIPHTREFYLPALQDMVIVAYPKKPIEWGSMDKDPVKAAFFMFACDDKRHLHLLAKLAHFANYDKTAEILDSRLAKPELLSAVKVFESSLLRPVCH